MKLYRGALVSKLLAMLNLLDRVFRCINSYLDYEGSAALYHDVNLIEVIKKEHIKAIVWFLEVALESSNLLWNFDRFVQYFSI